MKKKLSNISIMILFIAGLGFLLYPTISNIYNNMNQSKVIASYIEKSSNLDSAKYEELINNAKTYNNHLLEGIQQYPEQFTNNINYESDLKDFEGIIGYIEIPKINVKLPIYYGTSEEKLQVSIGQMKNSSFPTGDIGTHTVLVGHRGLPSAKLFTNLDKLKDGDIFYIYVLSEKLAFRVNQVKVVRPNELNDLKIDKNKAYTTLVTCTPYGINSHRLLVRGEKIDLNDASIKAYSFEDKIYIDIEKVVIVCWFVSLFTMIHCYKKLKFLS